jgi:ribosomal protein S18 acetylase RimI-like enzyme
VRGRLRCGLESCDSGGLSPAAGDPDPGWRIINAVSSPPAKNGRPVEADAEARLTGALVGGNGAVSPREPDFGIGPEIAPEIAPDIARTAPPAKRRRRKGREIGSTSLAVAVPTHSVVKGGDGKAARERRRARETRDPLPLPHGDRKQGEPQIEVRRMHRRDLNRAWEFLKLSFRDVNLATVEYQRPRSKGRFAETYEDEGVDQLLFEVAGEIVAYAECAHEIAGSDTWLNPRYFEKRDMRPLYVEEIAVHPEWHGNGVGSFVLEQLHHLAKVRGLSHLVLEVAENNENALAWYRKRGFRKLDAAIFLAHSVEAEPELLPPRSIEVRAEGRSETRGEVGAEPRAGDGESRKKSRKPKR